MSDSVITVSLSDGDVERIAGRVAALITEKRPDADDGDEFLTTVQAAALVKCSESHLEGLRSRGGGPRFLKIGGRRIRYRKRDLLAWMTSNVRSNTAKDKR